MHQSELVAPVRSKTTHSGQQQHGQAGPRHGVAGLRSLSHSLSDANLAFSEPQDPTNAVDRMGPKPPETMEAPTIPRSAKPARRICRRCGRTLKKIGTARIGGAKHHGDWSGRDLHKRCWTAMQHKSSYKKKGWRRPSSKAKRRF